MDLFIYISKKGMKVVVVIELYQVLQFIDYYYVINVKWWIMDIYEFWDDICWLEKFCDFVNWKIKGNLILKDYYLIVELAKFICLLFKSKVKLKYVKLLLYIELEEV